MAAWWITFTVGPLVWVVWLVLWVVISPAAVVLAALTGIPLGRFVSRQRAALWYWFWVFATLGALTNPEQQVEKEKSDEPG